LNVLSAGASGAVTLVEFDPEFGSGDADGLALGALDGPIDSGAELHPLGTVAVSVRVLVSVWVVWYVIVDGATCYKLLPGVDITSIWT